MCQYQAYLTYIKHEKGLDSIYGLLGTVMHDTLKKIVHQEATKADLLPALNEELELARDFGIDFPKDMRGGTTIRDNWIKDMKHFIANFTPLKGEFETEQLFILPVGPKRYLQGYIDLIRHNPDGTVSVFDWKTSSQFSDKDLKEHGRQLVLYSIALEQAGYQVRDCAWIMLKYVQVTFDGFARKNAKAKSQINKVIQRSKLYKELASYVKADLIDAGYSATQATDYVDAMTVRESMDELPPEIRAHYTIRPYIRKYEATDELKAEALDYVNQMAELFESKTDNEADWPHTPITKQNSFFCNTLCGYRKKCPYIQQYNFEYMNDSF